MHRCRAEEAEWWIRNTHTHTQAETPSYLLLVWDFKQKCRAAACLSLSLLFSSVQLVCIDALFIHLHCLCFFFFFFLMHRILPPLTGRQWEWTAGASRLPVATRGGGVRASDVSEREREREGECVCVRCPTVIYCRLHRCVRLCSNLALLLLVVTNMWPISDFLRQSEQHASHMFESDPGHCALPNRYTYPLSFKAISV